MRRGCAGLWKSSENPHGEGVAETPVAALAQHQGDQQSARQREQIQVAQHGNGKERQQQEEGGDQRLGSMDTGEGGTVPALASTRSLAAPFHQKHMEVGGQGFRAQLPQHQRDLAAVVGGMVRQMLHQVCHFEF